MYEINGALFAMQINLWLAGKRQHRARNNAEQKTTQRKRQHRASTKLLRHECEFQPFPGIPKKVLISLSAITLIFN